VNTKKIEYEENGVTLEAFVAFEGKEREKRPAVCVFHAWRGRDEFAEKMAVRLASLGYIGCALDVYGKGVQGNSVEENTKLMMPFIEDRLALRKRCLAGLDFVKQLQGVDSARVGAIGFCFGGLCALDLARSGADIKGVVSFHGLLHAPSGLSSSCKAKVLVVHGHDDPMVSPKEVLAFEEEMTRLKVDWQVHVYGGAMHAFTNPSAQDSSAGTLYNAIAERRSMVSMKQFFDEVFAS
jgi:dienelactone hydrolase